MNLSFDQSSIIPIGSGVSPLTRFCRDYMPYLFIGVIGLERCFFNIKKFFLLISYLYKDGSLQYLSPDPFLSTDWAKRGKLLKKLLFPELFAPSKIFIGFSSISCESAILRRFIILNLSIIY